MSRPVLFVIDDDAGVVHALRDDLSRRFGEDFRVIGESSAAAGLAVLRQLAGEQAPVALLIVDHDLSEMSGGGFLALAHDMHPLAKRVLLVERDYSARSPVVQAMTLGQADYHITKPWMLEQDLYREISEFLAEWAKDHQAGFELFRVIGRPQDCGTHELTRRACEQAWMFGAHMVFSQPTADLERRGGRRVVHLADGHQIAAKTPSREGPTAPRRPGQGWPTRSWLPISDSWVRSSPP
jgi:response regulator RpfG family c-di-GMP phosphodiesterase